jgi:hypothetical protein
MKDEAILNCRNLRFPCMGSDAFCMRAIMGSCSLAYIVDPANKTQYLQKVVETLPRWEDIIIVQSGADDGTRNSSNEYYTDATAAFFNTVLAIDIMYDDLANTPFSSQYFSFTNELSYAEFLMQQEFNHFYGITKPVYNFVTHTPDALAYHSPSRHPPAREAMMILWKIYKGEFRSDDPDSRALLFGGMLNNGYPDNDGDGKNIEGYLPEMDARVNESGVYTEGSSYAYAAWGLDRDERSHLIDVLEFTGKDREFGIDFYTNPRYINFYEWLYGLASTPFGVMTAFGDTYAFRQLTDDGHGGNSWSQSSHIGQAGIFSREAGSYAIWKSRGQLQQGRLLNYLFFQSASSNLRPVSKIYPNGGGFFIEPNASDYSLYGALWNVKKPTVGSVVFHVRKDVNSIYIAGYGEPLIMNGGFCGSSSPAGPDSCSGNDEAGIRYRFPGSYLGDRAVSNSVAILDYQVGNYLDPNPDGNGKFGGGVVEGFTTGDFDYVSGTTKGDSYNALSGGTQERSLVFIHGDGRSNGYFVVFDEFSELTKNVVNLVFHPNTSGKKVVRDLLEYDAPVGQKVTGNSSAGVTLFFATRPSSISFHRGIIATAGSLGSYVPEYFFNSYPASGQNRNIVTVLFPYDADHPKGMIEQIEGSGYSGARIDHGGGIIDTVLESSSATNVSVDGASLLAQESIFRRDQSFLDFYFVRRGKSFAYGSSRIGFDSSNDISIFIKGNSGKIHSFGSQVTFYSPGISSVYLDGVRLSNIQSGNGWVRVNIPSGTHDVSFNQETTTPTPFPGDANADGRVDGIDYIIWSNHFGQSTASGNRDGDFDNSGRVDIQDLAIWVSRYLSV